MELAFVALALLSAVLHAGWNAAVKARANVTHAMTAQMVLSGVIMLPLLFWTGLPAAASAPWIIASSVINMLTVTALLKAYALAGFGLVYPIARALTVVFVVPGAAIMFGETLSGTALAGVAGISAALALLAFGGRQGKGPPALAWVWIGLTGAWFAVNVLADAQGVRASGSAIAYGCCTSLLNGAAMLWRQRRAGIQVADIKREAPAMLPVAIAAIVSYLLILWLYARVPVAPAAALRDTSALFAVVLAVVWLKEPITRLQIAALVLAASSVPLLRLG